MARQGVSSEAHAHRCGQLAAAVLPRNRTPSCTSCSTRRTRREEATRKSEEKAAEGSDDVGLRRQGMRKTLKPAGDAQQPWPAAPMHSDFEQNCEQFNFVNSLGVGGPS